MGDYDTAGQRGDGGRGTVPEWALDRITREGVPGLDLSGRDFGGEIPAWVYHLTDLRRLNLARCRLTGTIPAELGQLARLEWLDLSGNQLSGVIPPELGELDHLWWLDLSGNQLSGVIPPELGKLRFNYMPWGARRLDLSGNQLSGVIPPDLSKLGGLTYLDLSKNRLSGEILSELGELGGLTYLDLSKNRLSGAIPPELSNLGDLIVLDLSENQLGGAIPAELGQLGNLRRLDLSENKLGGPIPRTFRSLLLEHLSLDASLGQRGLSPAQRKLVRKSRSHSNDELTALIVAGESKTVEFKSTLRANLHNEGKPDRRMEHEVLKNIAAFLNTARGTLIIGVDDDGEPLGLDNDGFLDEDEMRKYLRNIVNDQIGANVWGSVHPEFTSYRNERVLVIRCDKSSFPVYVGKSEEFYIRTGPGATALPTSQIPPYVSSHFSDSAPPTDDAPTDIA